MNKSNENSSDRKILTKYLLTSLLAVFIAVLIIIIAVLIIAFNRPILSPNGDSNKKQYQFDITTNVLDSSSSLDSGDNYVYQSDKEGDYYISVKFSSNENAGIGSYIDKDYLFHSYGGLTNTLTITFDVFNSKNEELVNNYTDLSISIFQGNKDDNGPLSDYQLNNNVISYSSSEEIYIYSISIGFKIGE